MRRCRAGLSPQEHHLQQMEERQRQRQQQRDVERGFVPPPTLQEDAQSLVVGGWVRARPGAVAVAGCVKRDGQVSYSYAEVD